MLMSFTKDASKAVTYRRQLIAGFSPRRPGVFPKTICVGFVVSERRAKGQILLGSISVSPCMYHSASTAYVSVITGTGYGPIRILSSKHNFTPPQENKIRYSTFET